MFCQTVDKARDPARSVDCFDVGFDEPSSFDLSIAGARKTCSENDLLAQLLRGSSTCLTKWEGLGRIEIKEDGNKNHRHNHIHFLNAIYAVWMILGL